MLDIEVPILRIPVILRIWVYGHKHIRVVFQRFVAQLQLPLIGTVVVNVGSDEVRVGNPIRLERIVGCQSFDELVTVANLPPLPSRSE